MASPASNSLASNPLNEDDDTDYGSDFSPEEELIVAQLLLRNPAGVDDVPEDDNPILNDIEHHDEQQTLRLPRVFGREERSPLFQAARAAEQVAEQISKSAGGEKYLDCVFCLSWPFF
jgi:exonuclease V